jgi:ABC-type multidrug transport system ATPase subunit
MEKILSFEGVNFEYELRSFGLFRRNRIKECSSAFGRALSGELSPGELIHLRGNNGVGKTTLLKLLSGILLPSNGVIKSKAFTVGLFEESVFHPELDLAVNFRLFAGLHGLDSGLYFEKFRGALPELLTGPEATYGELSQGARARYRLICAAILGPQILLLDEQTSSLDQRSRSWVAHYFQTFVAAGGAIIFTDHDARPGERAWELTASGLEFS